jgi:hypothetical protein
MMGYCPLLFHCQTPTRREIGKKNKKSQDFWQDFWWCVVSMVSGVEPETCLCSGTPSLWLAMPVYPSGLDFGQKERQVAGVGVGV